MKYQVRNGALVDRTHPASASLGKSVVLLDNLDKAIIMAEADRVSHFGSPFKYVSAMSLLLCLGGKFSFSIGSNEYTMSEDDVMLLGSGIICDIHDIDANARFCSMVFKEEFCQAFTEHLTVPFFQKVFVDHPVCHVSQSAMGGYVALYRMMKQALDDDGGSPLTVEVVRSHLLGMLFSVCQQYLSRKDAPPADLRKLSRKQDLYNRFVELVRQEFTQERGITYYANQLCVTPRYLSQVVQQESGYLAGDYIDRLVITEAQQLVQSQQYSIKQISQMLNFTSVSFFSRYFKKLTGYSPKEYQKL